MNITTIQQDVMHYSPPSRLCNGILFLTQIYADLIINVWIILRRWHNSRNVHHLHTYAS